MTGSEVTTWWPTGDAGDLSLAYGDVYWCHIVNDPFILWFDEEEGRRIPKCQQCDWRDVDGKTWKPSGGFMTLHTYLGNVNDLPYNRYGRSNPGFWERHEIKLRPEERA